MNKLMINGKKLREAISSMSLSIKGASEKGKIGEKTIHRMLNGEEIKETVIISFFQNLKMNYIEFLDEESSTNYNDEIKEEEIGYTANADSKIILNRFEVPDSTEVPLKILWKFDIDNPSQQILDILNNLNNILTKYCNYTKNQINKLDFDSSFYRLSTNTEIDNLIKKLEEFEIGTYSGIYRAWYDGYEDTTIHDELVKIYDSQKYLALYFTKNKFVKKYIAKVRRGDGPPFVMEKGYSHIIVDGDYNYYNENGELF